MAASMFAQWPLLVLQQKIPLQSESIFLITMLVKWLTEHCQELKESSMVTLLLVNSELACS